MAKIKVNTSETLVRAAQENTLMRCGDCLHFRGSRHPVKFDQPCVTLGVKPAGIAPECFTPNIAVFRRHNSGVLTLLSALLKSFSTAEHRILLGMLQRGASLKGKHRFMDARYFAVGGDGKYLSDYYRGYVVSRTVSKDPISTGKMEVYLLVGDKLFEGRNSVICHISAESLLDEKAFRAVKASLVEAQRINRPGLKRPLITVRKANDEEFEPPSIDTSDVELQARANLKSVKGKKVTKITITGREEIDIQTEDKRSQHADEHEELGEEA